MWDWYVTATPEIINRIYDVCCFFEHTLNTFDVKSNVFYKSNTPVGGLIFANRLKLIQGNVVSYQDDNQIIVSIEIDGVWLCNVVFRYTVPQYDINTLTLDQVVF